MYGDGRFRPMLPADLMQKLHLCGQQLGLSDECEAQQMITTVMHELTDRFLAQTPATQGRRGTTTAAERYFASETALASLGWDVTELKSRALPEVDPAEAKLDLQSLCDPLRQLLLLLPETPRSPTDVSRQTAVTLVCAGVRAHDAGRSAKLQEELAKIDQSATSFFSNGTAEDRSLSQLAAVFGEQCPHLRAMFHDLSIGPYTYKNTIHTETVKMEWMLILASAIGKVRNQKHCSLATALYALWKSLGVPDSAINILGNLGLSLSASDGAAKMRLQVADERTKLAKALKKKVAALECCIVFDNIDYMLGTRSFIKSEVDVRSRLIHVTAASAVFFRLKIPATSLPPFVRPEKLAISCLFPDDDCQVRIVSRARNVLHSVLHAYGHDFIGCHKDNRQPPLRDLDCGNLERSKRQAFPIFWLEEGKVDDMYKFAKDITGMFKPGSLVHFVGDCFSLLKLLAVRELLIGENVAAPRPDLDDFGMILVPGWFHLYWNVFLGSLLKSDKDLLALLLEIAQLKNQHLHDDISTCFNDVDLLARLLFPVAVVRLFSFFREVVAPSAQWNLGAMTESDIMLRFTLFITHTVQTLGRGSEVYFEWQRLCRVVLLLSVYRSLRIAIATENHTVMMDMLYFSVSLVCHGSFKQYRKVVIEAVAHFARSSKEERLIYMRSFTGNYSGGHFGGRAMDEIREFDNKATKENLRRNHRSEGDLAPELELTERHRESRLIFSSAFKGLDEGSGGAVPTLPDVEEVLLLAKREQWPKMTSPLPEEVAAKQRAFFDFTAYEQIVKDTIFALHRGSQFQ